MKSALILTELFAFTVDLDLLTDEERVDLLENSARDDSAVQERIFDIHDISALTSPFLVELCTTNTQGRSDMLKFRERLAQVERFYEKAASLA